MCELRETFAFAWRTALAGRAPTSAGVQMELDGIHQGAHAPAACSGAAWGAAPDVGLVEGEAAAGGPALDAVPPAAVSEERTCAPAGRDLLLWECCGAPDSPALRPFE